MTPWLSVVTVVKDASADFDRTLRSIRDQDLDGVELVVIDGSSDQRSIPDLLGAGPPATYRWSAPAGIYPAMNEGLRHATGDYVYFLNAGDTLTGPGVLARVRTVLDERRPEWMYAEVEMTDAHGRPLVTPPWDYDTERRACFSRGHFPCHQGTFARRDALLEVGGFDTGYRIVADYAAFLELSKRSDPEHLEDVVAAFQPGGVSTVRWREAIGEFHRARRRILAPRGSQAAREQFETWRLLARTAAYRSLWADGRIGHGLVGRVRGSRAQGGSPIS